MDSFTVLVDNAARIVISTRESFVRRYGDAFKDIDISVQRPAVTVKAWARDSSAYFYGPAKVVDADYASFKVIDQYRAQDVNGQYRGLKRL